MGLRGDHVHARGELFQTRERLGQRRIGQVILAEEIEQLGAQTDAGVELRVGARDVGAELDQVFGVAVGGQRLPRILRAASFCAGVAMALVSRLTEWRMSMAG